MKIWYMLFPWLTIFDFNTFRANFKKSVDLKKVRTRSADFAVLIPIFNDLKYLTNIDFLKQYSSHVVLCTTTNETPEFLDALKALADKYGFRIFRSAMGGDEKNPWAIYNKTLLAHDAVLRDSIQTLTEKYVIFLDGDTTVDGDFAMLCGAAEEGAFDLASVKVLPAKRTNVIEHLQGVEYDIAMQARLIYPWLTSGAGMVGKRSVLVEIMKNHSLFFNGGDIEIGKLAESMGYKVGHIPMPFYTDVPDTTLKWAKQRFSWMCGCFRHAIVNMDHNLRHPFHFIYFTFIIYFLLPLKAYELISHAYLIPLILAIYIGLTYIANWKVRSAWMVLFPFYALFQVMVLVWFGVYRYVHTAIRSKNIGRMRITHDPNGTQKATLSHFKHAFGNIGAVTVVMVAILLGVSSTAQKALWGRSYEPIEIAIKVMEAPERVLAAVDIYQQNSYAKE